MLRGFLALLLVSIAITSPISAQDTPDGADVIVGGLFDVRAVSESSSDTTRIETGLVFCNVGADDFPWFEPRYAPKTASELQALLSRSHVREKIVGLGVRYLVATAGATDTDDFPGVLCSYYGCFGLYVQDKITRVDAVVLDMMADDREARLQAKSAGTTLIPVFFIKKLVIFVPKLFVIIFDFIIAVPLIFV